MTSQPPIVLASASPRRRELLAALVDRYSVAVPDVPEDLGPDPVADAGRLALEKAREVLRRCPGPVVIGADTVVFDEERSYGKPATAAEAAAMLRALAGKTHTVATGVAVVSERAEWQACSLARVTMAPLTGEAIEAYVATGRPLDKAGAYAIQDEDVPTVAALEGCYCAVMGLPLWLLRGLLQKAGVAARPPSVALPRCGACPERA